MSCLILKRKVGQSIEIGEDVLLTVIEISGPYVRLAFDAPETVPIWRSEVGAEPRGPSDLPAGGHSSEP